MRAGSTTGQDVSSVDILSAEWFDRSTLDGLQQLWKSHAASMDGLGAQFADAIQNFQVDLIQVSNCAPARRSAQRIESLHSALTAAAAENSSRTAHFPSCVPFRPGMS